MVNFLHLPVKDRHRPLTLLFTIPLNFVGLFIIVSW